MLVILLGMIKDGEKKKKVVVLKIHFNMKRKDEEMNRIVEIMKLRKHDDLSLSLKLKLK